MLTDVGLKTKFNNMPNELSGGERQRVAIARSLVNDPEVIMADEPTGNLDSKSEAEIMKILLDLNTAGKTIIMVTHEESIGQQANRVIRLKDGRIVSDTKTPAAISSKEAPHLKALKANHDIPQTAQFMDYIQQSFQMIFSNKVRSLLSMLGVMIGVATVVAMLALGAGAKQSISDSLNKMGTNMLSIQPDHRNTSGVQVTLTQKDLTDILTIPTVKRVAPLVNGSVMLIVGNKNLSSRVQGTTPEEADMRNSQPAYGRMFTNGENQSRAKVAIIGTTVAAELFGEKDPVGKSIKINRINFQIIGVFPPLGGTPFQDRDNAVMIPLNTAMYRLLGKTSYDSIDIEINQTNQVSDAKDQISQLIIQQHNLTEEQKNAFRIMNMAELQDTVKKTANSLTFLLSFIASLSLLVGGIGIMNIMLVSVTERTREIGIRKAIGARKRDVMLQFVTEAIIMTFSGGLMGIVLGSLIAVILSKLANWVIVITPTSVLLSTTFAISIGLIFGIWPAKKAADLNTIEALRYE
jgi:macrolide transport system ATP-binding/permease protein